MIKPLVVRVTLVLLEQGMSHGGGWNQAQLACLGVEWPLKAGWKERVIGKVVPKDDADRFLALKGQTKEAKRTALPLLQERAAEKPVEDKASAMREAFERWWKNNPAWSEGGLPFLAFKAGWEARGA